MLLSDLKPVLDCALHRKDFSAVHKPVQCCSILCDSVIAALDSCVALDKGPNCAGLLLLICKIGC